MKKLLILAAYLLVFWIIIPVIIISASLYLDEFLELKKMNSVAAGIILTTFAATMLFISIIQYLRYTGKLPVSAFPPDKIIRQGLFNYWRHPIYLFYVLAFFGLSFLIRSRSMLSIVMPVFTLLTYLYILVEEKYLGIRFGQAYDYYRMVTGLIFPPLYQSARYPFILFLRWFFSYSVKNREMIPVSPPYFIVSEHKNYLDPFFIAAAVQHPISYLTTYEVYRSAVLGWLMKALFSIPKKRFRPDITSSRKLMWILESNGIIGLFPEGERSWTGETQDFKPDVLRLLIKNKNIPVLPVKIHGNYHAWPRWSEGLRRYRITVEFKQSFIPYEGMLPSELQMKLTRAIGDNSAPVKLSTKKYNLISGIDKVFYRCPECKNFNSFRINYNSVNCIKCGHELKVSDDLVVTFRQGNKAGTMSIGAYYNRLRFSPADLRYVVDFHENCILSIESGRKFRPVTRGDLRIGKESLSVTGACQQYILYYEDLSSVTTESNCKLQIFDARNMKLYQLTFQSSGVFQWQDIITSAIKMKTGKNVNTR